MLGDRRPLLSRRRPRLGEGRPTLSRRTRCSEAGARCDLAGSSISVAAGPSYLAGTPCPLTGGSTRSRQQMMLGDGYCMPGDWRLTVSRCRPMLGDRHVAAVAAPACQVDVEDSEMDRGEPRIALPEGRAHARCRASGPLPPDLSTTQRCGPHKTWLPVVARPALTTRCPTLPRASRELHAQRPSATRQRTPAATSVAEEGL